MKTPAEQIIIGYIEALLWTESDENEKYLDADLSSDDMATESMEQLTQDCQQFLAAFPLNAIPEIETWRHVGHDFLLTRNGHGAGFWDGDYPINGDKITALCEEFDPVNAYVGDDDLIYLG